MYDGRTKELFDGKRPIEKWGLKQPVLARLGALFGVEADSPEALCDQLELKKEKEGGKA